MDQSRRDFIRQTIRIAGVGFCSLPGFSVDFLKTKQAQSQAAFAGSGSSKTDLSIDPNAANTYDKGKASQEATQRIMRVIVVRHGPAYNLGESGSTTDESRRLTPNGRECIQRVALGLKEIQPQISKVLTSPYQRAEETAALLASVYNADIEPNEALESGEKARKVLRMLATRNEETLIIVGHQPTMGEVVALGSLGEGMPMFMKPGATACLDFESRVEPDGASLVWLMQPAQMELLSGNHR